MLKVSIIGVGLIGGSLGMALRKKGYTVYGIGRDEQHLNAAKKLGAVDEVSTETAHYVASSDIVVIASPVDTVAPIFDKISTLLKPGAVVTDVGSAKLEIIKACELVELNNKINCFVGAHPLAGSQLSGVAHGYADMFKGAACVLIQDVKKKKQLATVKKMWQDAGAEVVLMSASEHDKIVAVTSHLPHVLSFGICESAGKALNKDARLKKLVAGSFKDMTRVAESNPEDWAKILSQNKVELNSEIDKYINYLKWVKTNLKNPQKLQTKWQSCKSTRLKIIKS